MLEVIGVFAVANKVEFLDSLNRILLRLVLEHTRSQVFLLQPGVEKLMIRLDAVMVDVVREGYEHIERNVPAK